MSSGRQAMTEPGHRLLDTLMGGEPKARLSVIGLSKNAGKTETLNSIIRAAAERDVALGLVSTGRDGEDQDAVTELPKPHIWAPAGSWVASAREVLGAGTARIVPVRELLMQTPFGPMVIGRVEQEGEVLLIGPGTARRVGEVLSGLEACGASLVLVDGSFDRMAAAAPEVTGRTVLAAGAAFSPTMSETVTQVRFVLDLFDRPPVLPALAPAVEEAVRISPVSVVTLSGRVVPVPGPSALADPEPIVAAALELQAFGAHLVVDGALSDRLIGHLLKRRAKDIGLIVNNPTHILVERNLWRRWRRLGGEVYVRRPIRLMAVSTNPYSPVGPDYDARAFFESVRQIAFRPVFDVRAGLYAWAP